MRNPGNASKARSSVDRKPSHFFVYRYIAQLQARSSRSQDSCAPRPPAQAQKINTLTPPNCSQSPELIPFRPAQISKVKLKNESFSRLFCFVYCLPFEAKPVRIWSTFLSHPLVLVLLTDNSHPHPQCPATVINAKLRARMSPMASASSSRDRGKTNDKIKTNRIQKRSHPWQCWHPSHPGQSSHPWQ